MRPTIDEFPATAELRIAARRQRDDVIGSEARWEIDRRAIRAVVARDRLAKVVARIREPRGRREAAHFGVEVEHERVVQIARALGEREDPIAAVARDVQCRVADGAAEAALAVANERLTRAIRRIGGAVTVVVHAVAGVGRAWIDGRVRVVAVGIAHRVAAWCRARLLRGRCSAIGIAIGVDVERRGDAFVDRTVAVVVDRVADFGRAGVDGGV